MYVIESEAEFIYASVTEGGRALVSFKDLLFSSVDPNGLLDQFTQATEALRKSLNEYDAENVPPAEVARRDPLERLNTWTRSVDIEDVKVGDQIRVRAFWHRLEEINERLGGITVKTTRNEWFAFDHGDRVTIAVGGDDE